MNNYDSYHSRQVVILNLAVIIVNRWRAAACYIQWATCPCSSLLFFFFFFLVQCNHSCLRGAHVLAQRHAPFHLKPMRGRHEEWPVTLSESRRSLLERHVRKSRPVCCQQERRYGCVLTPASGSDKSFSPCGVFWKQSFNWTQQSSLKKNTRNIYP